ncbi:efflux RND transporter periplasmic adaptor subunit [Agaribacterium sp. ZY112]|uniref:efflux RND transporter periplasmic adaptor subunit n=1 Tax=Agaribacterium sp. ZY112 TaxID=3233574 RepID=UPI0035255009
MTTRLSFTAALILFSILCHAQSPIFDEDADLLNCRIEASMVIEMSSEVEGVINKVHVDVNDRISAGDTLATLHAHLEQATVRLRKLQSELVSEIDAAELAYAFSQRNLKRIQNLYDKKVASFSELDKAKTENAIAEQEKQQAHDRKKQAELQYERALADLNRRTLTSPIDGIVVDRYKQPGEHIDFDPLLKIAQLDPLVVKIFAPSSLYGKIKEGMRATIKTSVSNIQKTYNAEVSSVDKVIDAPSNTFAIKINLANPDSKLPSGLKCTVEFEGIELNLLSN